jgi:acyl-coenzyme A synthetase/AMP-(fatty) acid ligase
MMTAVNPERYHVTLAADGRPLMHGWWGSEATARRKFISWVGEYGSLPGARVTLVDEETGSVLTTWQGEP